MDFAKILQLLQLAVVSGLIKGNVATALTVVNDVQAVVNGAKSPTTDLVAPIQKLLGDLKTSGVITGAFIDQLAADAGKYAAWVKEAQAGQSIVLKMGEFAGVKGAYTFNPEASDQYKSLGL